MTTTLVELCAGTAAVSFALRGLQPPVSMAGSKRTLAKQLIEKMGLRGVVPAHTVWVDPGEWGLTLATLRYPTLCLDTAEIIGGWAPEDERELFDRLRATPPPTFAPRRAATHLYLQSRTYRGKPVYPTLDGTGWVTHGFDPEFRAAVTPGAKSRGWFNARPVLSEKVCALADVSWGRLDVVCASALDVAPIPGSVVYIDPQYRGTTGYGPPELSRDAVVEMARRHHAAGCRVFVSEAEPAVPGWPAEPLDTRRGGTQLAVHREWLTRSP